jgi:hypothetical protein
MTQQEKPYTIMHKGHPIEILSFNETPDGRCCNPGDLFIRQQNNAQADWRIYAFDGKESWPLGDEPHTLDDAISGAKRLVDEGFPSEDADDLHAASPSL